MKKTLRIFLWGFMTALFISCGDDEKESEIETPEITFTKEGEAFLLKNGVQVKKLDIEVANTPYEWSTGLMYRESIEDEQGMLFIYPGEAQRYFYMKNTYIPLDIIFYSKDSTVVSFHENAQPLDETSIPSKEPAKFILEVNAGKAMEWNIEIGDKIDFTIK